MRVVVIVVVIIVASAIVIACGAARLPSPDYTSHPTSALVEVSYPPPPARVESVPERPSRSAVWIDGEWLWQTRRWSWKRGRWIVPPSDARFAPWTAVRDRAGTLYVAAGAWRDSKGNEVSEPAPVATGKPQPAAIVNPEGEPVERGPNARKDDALNPDGDASASSGSMLGTEDASMPTANPNTNTNTNADAASPSEK